MHAILKEKQEVAVLIVSKNEWQYATTHRAKAKFREFCKFLFLHDKTTIDLIKHYRLYNSH